MREASVGSNSNSKKSIINIARLYLFRTNEMKGQYCPLLINRHYICPRVINRHGTWLEECLDGRTDRRTAAGWLRSPRDYRIASHHFTLWTTLMLEDTFRRNQSNSLEEHRIESHPIPNIDSSVHDHLNPRIAAVLVPYQTLQIDWLKSNPTRSSTLSARFEALWYNWHPRTNRIAIRYWID